MACTLTSPSSPGEERRIELTWWDDVNNTREQGCVGGGDDGGYKNETWNGLTLQVATRRHRYTGRIMVARTAKEDGGKMCKRILCDVRICESRNESPNVVRVSVGSRSGYPSRKGCMVNSHSDRQRIPHARYASNEYAPQPPRIKPTLFENTSCWWTIWISLPLLVVASSFATM